MPSKSLVSLALAAGLSFTLLSASAHHSVSGQFDRDRPVSVTGVITQVEWINPHTYIHLESRDQNGAVTMWQFESAPTAMLRKVGLTKEMLMGGGATVTIDAILARDGTENFGWLLKIQYPDGHFYQLSGDR
ncbi:MAG TPA: DUF6152 family protein [Gammaproteobacteria bacterium]|jgi:hypothetical protein